MPYRVQFSSLLERQIRDWQLSDAMLIEVHLRLRQDLSNNPAQSLIRLRQPFDGMCHAFEMIDPENRVRQHQFVFLAFYGMDEEHLIVARGTYRRVDG